MIMVKQAIMALKRSSPHYKDLLKRSWRDLASSVIDKMNGYHNSVAPPAPVRMGGRVSDIALSSTIVTVPMLALAAVLLILVYHFRITPSGVANANSGSFFWSRILR